MIWIKSNHWIKSKCLKLVLISKKFSTFPKKLVLVSKNEIKGKSKCVICLTERTFIHEIEDKYIAKLSMKTYCMKCRKNTENLNSKIFKTKNVRLIIQSKCPVWEIKKSRFVKEAKGLLSNLGIKTTLSKIPLLNILF